MDKNYFLSLSKIQKIDFIWNYGEVITELQTSTFYKSLFVLHDFFVEIRLSKHSDEITSISVLENTDNLYTYVKGIDLNILQLG
ncbi:hypothetical protein CNR22_04455 [Sphingobacteriaceae bacterium]|nr:hypothetical protein CNR22_04455 [Sphingobacteriaceae bacterium]